MRFLLLILCVFSSLSYGGDMPDKNVFIETITAVKAPDGKQHKDFFQKDISDLLGSYFLIGMDKAQLIERLQALDMERMDDGDNTDANQLEARITLNKKHSILGLHKWETAQGTVHIVFTFVNDLLSTFKATKYFSRNSPLG